MNVQLIDIDLEVEEIQEESRPFFVYNKIDMMMMFFCFILSCIMIGFFIWFGITHSK